jgi:acyl dehydratase/putative flippase GtrA
VHSDGPRTGTQPAATVTGPVDRLRGRLSHLVREIGKFGVVGFISFLVDTALFNLCLLVIGFGPLTSKTFSVTVAATLAFAGNRYWTWRHRRARGLAREYFLYFVFNAVGLLIALLCLGGSHYILGSIWPVFTSPFADNVSGNGVGLVLGTLFRFYSYRRWVFLPPDAPPVDPHTGLPEAPEAERGPAPEWYYDELVPGRRFDLGTVVVDEAEMLAFAQRYDPQWYHVDPERAATGEHGGLIASGWYTASLFMRAYVDHVLTRAAAFASPGVEELRWTAPVRAGDRLAGLLEVVDRKPSATRPGLGTVTLAGSLARVGPDGEPDQEVLRLRFRGWFGTRPDRGETAGVPVDAASSPDGSVHRR